MYNLVTAYNVFLWTHINVYNKYTYHFDFFTFAFILRPGRTSRILLKFTLKGKEFQKRLSSLTNAKKNRNRKH